MYGGETWTFNTGKQMTGTGGGVPSANPGTFGTRAPITSGQASFPVCAASTSSPGVCPVLEQDAPFFGSGFNFLAPTVGSSTAAAFNGVGTITALNFSTNTLTIFMPATNAQWAGGNYVIGADPTRSPPGILDGDKISYGVAPTGPGVTFTGTISNVVNSGPITFNFRLYGERTMTRDEVTVPAFAAQTVQWELPGSASIDNQNPVANTDNLSAPAATTSVQSVRSNDTDPDWTLLGTTAYDTLTITALGTPSAGGSVTTNGSTVSYTPVIASGPESYTYTISDGRGGTSVGTVNVNVIAAGNIPPTANDDPDATTNEGVPVDIDVLANDTDPDVGDTLSVTAVTQGANGSVTNNTTDVTYTPNPGFFGTDSFTYTMWDGTDSDGPATVTVTVSEYIESSSGTVTSFTQHTAGDFNVDPDVTASCVGGCFGFTITGVTSGGQVNITLPELAGDIPQRPVYRKYISGAWLPLAAPDEAKSAPLDGNGRCPPPGSGNYGALTTGHKCVQLTLTDNGGNDTDGTLTVLTDPGGVGSLPQTVAKENTLSSGGAGCSVNPQAGNPLRADWLIVGAFLSWLGFTIRRKKRG
jgi:hypothetical protein